MTYPRANRAQPTLLPGRRWWLSAPGLRLWQSGARNRHPHDFDLAAALCSRLRRHVGSRGTDVQVAAVGAPEHAGERVAARQRDRVRDRTAVGHPDHPVRTEARDPDSTIRVNADPVRHEPRKRPEYAAVAERPIFGDVERRQALAERLGDDEGPSVSRDGGAIGEPNAIGGNDDTAVRM